MSEATIGRQTQ
jgi:hypothetical protein